MRRWRAAKRHKAEQARVPRVPAPGTWPLDPGLAISRWSAKCLKVPPGHPQAGKPLKLPPFAVKFISSAYADGVREAALFTGRKNAKSAICAVAALAHLCGPLRKMGWRCGTASLSREKATELWTQMQAIAQASELLQGLTFGRVPRHVASDVGRVDFLSADRSAGAASGFDLVLVDEVGLFPEAKGADLVQGLLSSVSARNGRTFYISVQADSALTLDLRKRAETDPAVVVHCYEAPRDCHLDDEAAWRLANPGLETVKSIAYMRDAARRAREPQHEPSFRLLDLNQRVTSSAELIVSLADWLSCVEFGEALPEGPLTLGIDAGGSRSMTSAVAFFPDTGRLDAWGAYPAIPSLAERGRQDGVGDRYEQMEARGELKVCGEGRVTDVAQFMAWVASELPHAPLQVGADRYRMEEVNDFLASAKLSGEWAMHWRPVGAGPDGVRDIRMFQRLVEAHEARPGESLLFESALAQSKLEYINGNPRLAKTRAKARIDAVQAAVISVGLGSFLPAERERVEDIYLPL